MAESDGQERTEEATPRRLQQAREKGQVARSKELASVSVLVVGAISLMWFGDWLSRSLYTLMGRLFSLSREEIFDLTKLFDIAFGAMGALLWLPHYHSFCSFCRCICRCRWYRWD